MCFIANCIILSAQNIPSPQQFLGYELGEHFTPTYKIVNYFNAVAQAILQWLKCRNMEKQTKAEI